MATKEDILEQVVEEFLISQGYFVQHNLRFRPHPDHPDFNTSTDSNHSDIDVLGLNPKLRGRNRVVAVSCKSWQGGFNPAAKIRQIEEDKIVGGRNAWKTFRELTSDKWSEAFTSAIYNATGTKQFTHITAVAKLIGNKTVWENYLPFQKAMNGNPIKVITFREMVTQIQSDLTHTLASTEVGRLLQMFRAAEIYEAIDADKSQQKKVDG